MPVFVTALMAIRRMSNASWPGFSTEGALWFPDLSLPALDLANLTAPIGSVGAVLPAAIALALFQNLSISFGNSGDAPQQPGEFRW